MCANIPTHHSSRRCYSESLGQYIALLLSPSATGTSTWKEEALAINKLSSYLWCKVLLCVVFLILPCFHLNNVCESRFPKLHPSNFTFLLEAETVRFASKAASHSFLQDTLQRRQILYLEHPSAIFFLDPHDIIRYFGI